MNYKSITAFCLLFILFFSTVGRSQNFASEGNGLRNAVVGKIDGKNILFCSELDGAVSCYSMQGELKWKNHTDAKAVLFEIQAADLNNDGNTELLAASGDGNIYCWNEKGTLNWKFNPGHKVRFSEVAVLRSKNGIRVYAGGNDYTLYELNEKGTLLSKTNIKGVVRKIEVGNFIHKGEPSVFLMTYGHDKFRWEFFGFLNPETKETIRSLDLGKAQNSKLKDLTKVMMTDFDIADINRDGLDDILVFGDVSWQGYFAALDGNFDLIASYKAEGTDNQRYAHAQGLCLLPIKNEVVFRLGSILYVCDLNGNLIEKVGHRYGSATYSDLVLDKKNKTLYTAGDLGGGNGIYAYPLENPEWFNISHEHIGRYKEVQNNLNALYQSVLRYKMPTYQHKSDKPWMMISSHKLTPEVQQLKGNDIVFIKNAGTWSENTDRGELVETMGEVALKKDHRKRYDLSREDIIERAKDMEASKTPFVLWAGHGNDPFYTRVETLEKVLELAPNTCFGFIYAEMDNVEDPRVIHFIREYVPRLAKAIRKHNKAKLYFRYKNMFWATTSHLSPWKELFFSGEYSDILVPASEDTSSRTQDVNLAGRVGMITCGYINDFAMRLIDDNPTSWRPLTPGGQRTVSPYLRQGVLMAAYGARIGINFDGLFLEKPKMEILYALMKSGVLPLVDKDDILSIGAYHLIKEVDEKLIHSVDDHHNLLQYSPDDENAVFSVAQMHWAGANIPEYDYSKVSLGVEYRWLNYVPLLPNGMVPIAPIEYEETLKAKQIPYSVSNAKQGFVNGSKVSAKEFGASMKKNVESGAEKLLLTVKGASWSLIRLDDTHARLVLVDPGYIDPQERDVVVTLQRQLPIKVNDILSGEKITIKNGKLNLKVPAGSLRFVDLEYKTQIK